MLRPAVRVTLLLVFLAAMGSTASLFWIAERGVHRSETAARAFDQDARASIADVMDLRAAQRAYVASGQGSDFWFSRTNTLQNQLKGRVAALRNATSSSEAVAAFENALGALQDFEQMDVRARERARAKQFITASDLIFSDGVDLTRKIAESIDQGRVAARVGFDDATAALERRQLFSLGAAATTATLIVVLLVPVRREEIVVPQPSLLPEEPEPMSLVVGRGVVPPPPQEVPAPEPVVVSPPRQPTDPPEPPQPMVDLPGMARLCGDMARISDTRALPGMLERAAGLLDASGIVLWIADPDGRELAPIVAHGYPPEVVTRLGTIPRSAENATAAAFRTCLLQTVDTDAVSGGAIAAPLMTPSGCVGVMAAEIRNEGEQQEAILAAAGILAAQLATLVGPPSSRIKADAVS